MNYKDIYEKWVNPETRAELVESPKDDLILSESVIRPYTGDYYNQVLSGFFKPPKAGKYRFWMAVDDNMGMYMNLEG